MHEDDREHQHDEHDLGLVHDLTRMVDRRRSLSLLGGAGLVALAACSSGLDPRTASSTSSTGSTSSTIDGSTTTAGGASCSVIPEETGGPYPGDGSNGVNVLEQSGIVRSDITSSFGSRATVADGVPLTVRLTVVDTANGCAPRAGAAVYLWHCDREARYSLYSPGVTGENYLRGVQPSADDGTVTFRSIFPGAYSGRWPHMHFEVYPSVDDATATSGKLRTSQLALPENVCNVVYATTGYEQSVRNLARTSLDEDMVFNDGWSLQMATVTGSAGEGHVASLDVPV